MWTWQRLLTGKLVTVDDRVKAIHHHEIIGFENTD